MSRIITITGKTQGRLIITPPDENGDLLVQREYVFAGDDVLLSEIETQSFNALVAWAVVPQTIKDALTVIDTWTSDQIDTEQGL